MQYIFPDYYKQFKCIASECQHSCCIGWEIDIDPDTSAYYNTVSGAFGQRLKQNISRDGIPGRITAPAMLPGGTWAAVCCCWNSS